jgi:hypothetical protein
MRKKITDKKRIDAIQELAEEDGTFLEMETQHDMEGFVSLFVISKYPGRYYTGRTFREVIDNVINRKESCFNPRKSRT